MITPVLACIGGLHSTGGASFTGVVDDVTPGAEGAPFRDEAEKSVLAPALTPSAAEAVFGGDFRFKR
jgi:hypothetical protein